MGSRRMVLATVVAVLVLLFATPALASTPRQSAYYEVWCNLGTDCEFQAETFSASAFQPDKIPGGKDTGIANYTANNQFGDVCVALGSYVP